MSVSSARIGLRPARRPESFRAFTLTTRGSFARRSKNSPSWGEGAPAGLEEGDGGPRLDAGVGERPVERGHLALAGQPVLQRGELPLELGRLAPEAHQGCDPGAAPRQLAVDGRGLRPE